MQDRTQDTITYLTVREMLGPSAEELRAKRRWDELWAFLLRPTLALAFVYCAVRIVLISVATSHAFSAVYFAEMGPEVPLWAASIVYLANTQGPHILAPLVGAFGCTIAFALGEGAWEIVADLRLWWRMDLPRLWAEHVAAVPPKAGVIAITVASLIAVGFGGALVLAIWMGMWPTSDDLRPLLLQFVFVCGSVSAVVLLRFRAATHEVVARRAWMLGALGALALATAMPGFYIRLESTMPELMLDDFDPLGFLVLIGMTALVCACGVCVWRSMLRPVPLEALPPEPPLIAAGWKTQTPER